MVSVGRTDIRMQSGIDAATHGHTNTWTHGRMDAWTHGRMDAWTHGQKHTEENKQNSDEEEEKMNYLRSCKVEVLRVLNFELMFDRLHNVVEGALSWYGVVLLSNMTMDLANDGDIWFKG